MILNLRDYAVIFQLPNERIISCYYEPMVNATIIAPDTYISNVVELCRVCILIFLVLNV